MESSSTKRPRGRPRIEAPPRDLLHIRAPAAIKAELEQDARTAHRSVTKEVVTRVCKSYLSDDQYGGPELASLFRQMGEATTAIETKFGQGSFFQNFEVHA